MDSVRDSLKVNRIDRHLKMAPQPRHRDNKNQNEDIIPNVNSDNCSPSRQESVAVFLKTKLLRLHTVLVNTMENDTRNKLLNSEQRILTISPTTPHTNSCLEYGLNEDFNAIFRMYSISIWLKLEHF